MLAIAFRFIILSLLFIHYSTNNKIVATKYGLTDKQTDSLKVLFEEQRAKQKALRKAHKENRDIMHEKISNILTKEQMEEFEEMKPKKPHR